MSNNNLINKNEILLKQKKEALLIKEKEANIKEKNLMLERATESAIKRDYLKDNFFKSLGVMFFTLLTFISAITYFSYSYFYYTPPSKFLALDSENRVLEEIPLMEDVMTEEGLTQWANEQMSKILTYNYISYPKHGGKIKDVFTNDGYSEFMDAFNNLKLQIKVKEQKAIVEPILVTPLKIENVGDVGNRTRKAWVMKGLIVLNIHGVNGKEIQKYEANMLIIRTTFKENKYGVAIRRIQLIN